MRTEGGEIMNVPAPTVTQTSYAVELEHDDFMVIVQAEDRSAIEYANHLIWKLTGGRETHHTGIDGVHSVEYNGHFGACIYYTVDADRDIPAVHELVNTMIRSAIEEGKTALEAQE